MQEDEVFGYWRPYIPFWPKRIESGAAPLLLMRRCVRRKFLLWREFEYREPTEAEAEEYVKREAW